ncbi:hypothetical protein [Halalkalibacter nanhaiisediminis]|uniref:Uncharacterized protein n=1 Tax=Halalkalibacter nanhaiisediminis TaxID=688079 RepID=A0A562QRH2_9BACI|nr:hypothetical protein [Halalkalibacter nanhaiisediminis]TWI59324.1 hypothetical protein IQ10_01040 [Halalkalibacter nanhaiisediminis]
MALEKQWRVNDIVNESKINEDLKLNLEKQVAAAVWLQTIGKIAEAIILLKLFLLGDDSDGEKKILTGVWVQAVGQLSQAIGVEKQITATTKEIVIEGQKIAITGDWYQTIGAALQAIGGEQVLVEEQQEEIVEFVP